jgi:choline dehydrogenase-like flavoprotein
MSKSSPSRYETDAFGRLGHTNHVYVVDSAAFPTIPSKNLTFTIMAHAMRVADNVRRQFS